MDIREKDEKSQYEEDEVEEYYDTAEPELLKRMEQYIRDNQIHFNHFFYVH